MTGGAPYQKNRRATPVGPHAITFFRLHDIQKAVLRALSLQGMIRYAQDALPVAMGAVVMLAAALPSYRPAHAEREQSMIPRTPQRNTVLRARHPQVILCSH